MCICDPEKRTPWCGKEGCEAPEQVPITSTITGTTITTEGILKKKWYEEFIFWPEQGANNSEIENIIAIARSRFKEEAVKALSALKRPNESDFDEKVRNTALKEAIETLKGI